MRGVPHLSSPSPGITELELDLKIPHVSLCDSLKKTVGQLLQLCRLTLNTNDDSLENLPHLDHYRTMLFSGPLQCLEELSSQECDCDDVQMLSRFIAGVGHALSYKMLKHLSIQSRDADDKEGPSDLDVLRPLLGFHNLEKLAIDFYAYHVHLDDNAVYILATSWPRLRHLKIWCTYPKPETVLPTIESLSILVQHLESCRILA